MHRTAELRRADAAMAVPASSLPSKPVRLEPILLIHRRGHWNGWELFVRLLIFATRNNHRPDRKPAHRPQPFGDGTSRREGSKR